MSTKAHIHFHDDPEAHRIVSAPHLHLTLRAQGSVVVSGDSSHLDSRVADEVLIHLDREAAEAVVRELQAALAEVEVAA